MSPGNFNIISPPKASTNLSRMIFQTSHLCGICSFLGGYSWGTHPFRQSPIRWKFTETRDGKVTGCGSESPSSLESHHLELRKWHIEEHFFVHNFQTFSFDEKSHSSENIWGQRGHPWGGVFIFFWFWFIFCLFLNVTSWEMPLKCPLPKHKPELVCSHNMAGMLPQI